MPDWIAYALITGLVLWNVPFKNSFRKKQIKDYLLKSQEDSYTDIDGDRTVAVDDSHQRQRAQTMNVSGVNKIVWVDTPPDEIPPFEDWASCTRCGTWLPDYHRNLRALKREYEVQIDSPTVLCQECRKQTYLRS